MFLYEAFVISTTQTFLTECSLFFTQKAQKFTDFCALLRSRLASGPSTLTSQLYFPLITEPLGRWPKGKANLAESASLRSRLSALPSVFSRTATYKR